MLILEIAAGVARAPVVACRNWREILMLWVVLGAWASWVLGYDKPRASVGDICGPEHHWIYIRTSLAGSDLSCERD